MPLFIDIPTEIDRQIFKQLDFAIVRTLTKAAQVAQKAIQDSLPQRFTLRNTFVFNSIRTKAATKADPTAAVYVPTDGKYNADFLIRQETGGFKVPGGKYLAIPENIKRSRANRKGVGGGIIRGQDRPRELLSAGSYRSTRRRENRVFKIDDSTPQRYRHGLKFGIYAAHPNQKNHRTGNQGITLLYSFVPRAKVPQRFHFQATATQAAQDALPGLFQDSLNEALRTAR
jgi:hypothetical protein